MTPLIESLPLTAELLPVSTPLSRRSQSQDRRSPHQLLLQAAPRSSIESRDTSAPPPFRQHSNSSAVSGDLYGAQYAVPQIAVQVQNNTIDNETQFCKD